jgi:hypothetical protein
VLGTIGTIAATRVGHGLRTLEAAGLACPSHSLHSAPLQHPNVFTSVAIGPFSGIAITTRPEGVNSVWWCCALGVRQLELTLELCESMQETDIGLQAGAAQSTLDHHYW